MPKAQLLAEIDDNIRTQQAQQREALKQTMSELKPVQTSAAASSGGAAPSAAPAAPPPAPSQSTPLARPDLQLGSVASPYATVGGSGIEGGAKSLRDPAYPTQASAALPEADSGATDEDPLNAFDPAYGEAERMYNTDKARSSAVQYGKRRGILMTLPSIGRRSATPIRPSSTLCSPARLSAGLRQRRRRARKMQSVLSVRLCSQR